MVLRSRKELFVFVPAIPKPGIRSAKPPGGGIESGMSHGN
jgi:hypothetical protein